MQERLTLAELMTCEWARIGVERLNDLGIDDYNEVLEIIRAVRAAKLFYDAENATVDSFLCCGENYTAAEFLQSSHYNK